jgi:hypothetical protein
MLFGQGPDVAFGIACGLVFFRCLTAGHGRMLSRASGMDVSG